VSLGSERRNESCEHDKAGVGHQPCNLADPADILDPVGFGEAEIAIEAMANIVAIEQEGVTTAGGELLLDEIRDR
jgi:hypothetical protein